MSTLTTEQIVAINDSLTQPINDAIVGVLTAEPYLLTPEDATAAAEEYTGAGSDALIAYFSGADTDASEGEAETSEEAAKSYKSNFAKRLLAQKAGAKLSGATKAELAKAIEHAATIKASANAIVKTVKSLAESAADDDEKSAVTDELKAIRAELETLKAVRIKEPNIDELITKALQNI